MHTTDGMRQMACDRRYATDEYACMHERMHMHMRIVVHVMHVRVYVRGHAHVRVRAGTCACSSSAARACHLATARVGAPGAGSSRGALQRTRGVRAAWGLWLSGWAGPGREPSRVACRVQVHALPIAARTCRARACGMHASYACMRAITTMYPTNCMQHLGLDVVELVALTLTVHRGRASCQSKGSACT